MYDQDDSPNHQYPQTRSRIRSKPIRHSRGTQRSTDSRYRARVTSGSRGRRSVSGRRRHTTSGRTNQEQRYSTAASIHIIPPANIMPTPHLPPYLFDRYNGQYARPPYDEGPKEAREGHRGRTYRRGYEEPPLYSISQAQFSPSPISRFARFTKRLLLGSRSNYPRYGSHPSYFYVAAPVRERPLPGWTLKNSLEGLVSWKDRSDRPEDRRHYRSEDRHDRYRYGSLIPSIMRRISRSLSRSRSRSRDSGRRNDTRAKEVTNHIRPKHIGEVTLDPLLVASVEDPGLYWDMTFPPATRVVKSLSPLPKMRHFRTRRCSSGDLARAATIPPCIEMNVFARGLRKPILIYRRDGITVGDILIEIYLTLTRSIPSRSLNKASRATMERILEASRRRVQGKGKEFSQTRDVRVIDLWGEGHWFGGLEPSHIDWDGILCCNLTLFWSRLIED